MMGAALRGGALVALVCGCAIRALASTDVTDQDRMWANFTREAAIVGDKHLWLELRGMKLDDDVGGPTLGLSGYPLKDPTIDDINGGRFDLVGAYGIGAAELGIDLPFVMQEQIKYTDGSTVDHAGIGDLLLYGKFKRQLAEHWAGALGLELSAPSGSSRDYFGSGNLGLNPFLSTRYQSGPFAVGGHVGFLLNTGSQPDVFNWSVEGVVRGNELFALRCEFNGRLFRAGQEFNDIAVWPGIDLNLIDHIIIRPQGMAHLTDDAIDWGVGIGLVFTL
jgi:hypothetical protein